MQQAIYEDLPIPLRKALHRDAASALASSGADVSKVASHMLLGAEQGDLEAVRWLREAAVEETATAPAIAVKFLRRAIELLPAGHGGADLVSAELAEALQNAGQVAEAAAMAEAVLARPHSDEVASRFASHWCPRFLFRIDRSQ